MIKLLQILFLGHAHRWEVYSTAVCSADYGLSTGMIVYHKCEECQKIKRTEVQ